MAFASIIVTRFSRPDAVYRRLEDATEQVETALAWRKEDTSPVLKTFLNLTRETLPPPIAP